MSKIIESLSGIGKVFEGNNYIVDVSYELQFLEDSSGFKDISGQIEVLGDKNLIFRIFDTSSTTTLHLSDTRQINFILGSSDITSGYGWVEHGSFN